jgi:putative SOS response-associated peptidase YedK
MCGRYVTPDEAALERFWHIGAHNWLQFTLPVFNVAPTTQVPIILRGTDAPFEAHAARWGLVPHWWKQPQPPSMTFNARAEEAAEKPTWRTALRSQRCLVPVSGWYEWQVVVGAKVKQPHFIHVPGEEVLALAGLWSRWTSPAGPVLTCAVLTTVAAPAIAQIHHRMPVALKAEQFTEWLDPATPAARVQEMLAGARADLEGYPVSTRVNNTRNNSPDLLDRMPGAA